MLLNNEREDVNMVIPDYLEFRRTLRSQRDSIQHSAKGSTWKEHKYIRKENGRYIYPDDDGDVGLTEMPAIGETYTFKGHSFKVTDKRGDYKYIGTPGAAVVVDTNTDEEYFDRFDGKGPYKRGMSETQIKGILDALDSIEGVTVTRDKEEYYKKKFPKLYKMEQEKEAREKREKEREERQERERRERESRLKNRKVSDPFKANIWGKDRVRIVTNK